MTDNRGRFVWYDLMTTEPDKAQSFYTELVGWGTTPWKGGDQPYTMWTNGDNPLGGVNPLPDEARKAGLPPHWLGYIRTPDVDDTLAQAEKLGAKTMVPGTDIPTVGRFAVLADPQGAVVAIYTPAESEPGSGKPPEKGDFSWHELATTDPEAAFSFYQELFGWEKTEAMDMGEAGIYQMYRNEGGSLPLGGIYKKPEQMPGPPAWLYYVMVEDVKSAVEDVQKLGGRVLNGPMEVPGGDLVAQCLDPQGAAFAIHSTAK